MVARLLAYALCYEEGLLFTKGICDGDAPDIWLKDENDRIAHWIEVGLPTPERITTACKKATKVTIFLYGQHTDRWQKMHQQQLQRLKRLTLFRLPEELLQQAVNDLQRSINWSLTITEGQIYLTTDRQDLEGQLLRIN